MNDEAITDAFCNAAAEAQLGETASDSALPHAPDHPSAPFGAALVSLMLEACGGRLRDVHWFRTDWQRGGALTGYATWRHDDGVADDVVVKMPVPPRERLFMTELAEHEHIVPHIYASGDALGGSDMCWLVMERLPYGPVDSQWGGAAFDLTIEAVCRCYRALQDVPVTVEPKRFDWVEVLKRCRQVVRQNDTMSDAARWKKVLKAAQKKLPAWVQKWEARPTDTWCHGDLHLGNAMARHAPPNGPVLLLDFALTHPGHWVEDAVYFEHLYWSRRDKLEGRKITRQMAHTRKQMGLAVDGDWPQLAQVKRALTAMSAPAFLNIDKDPSYLRACLELLESEV